MCCLMSCDVNMSHEIIVYAVEVHDARVCVPTSRMTLLPDFDEVLSLMSYRRMLELTS